jgi:AraC-like DNA-binding protein
LPLFIDLHIDSNLTPDLIRQCHVADKAIQRRYGVRYLQILLNQPQGYLFCLVEGPDKDACARVHQEAHGNIACNILEITESDFSALLANKAKDGLDFTLNHDGTLDTGNRAILSLDLLGVSDHCRAARSRVSEVFVQYSARAVESPDNRVKVFFDSCSSAVEAGLAIGTRISELNLPVEARMGIDIGPPLKEKGNLFEDVCKSAALLSFFSENGQVIVSSKVIELCNGHRDAAISAVKEVNPADERFLNQIMTGLEEVWKKDDITITGFAQMLGMSKSQLARRLKSLSVLPPNDLLKEFRLRKSIHLMQEEGMNMAEVTMAIGFTNPSYFAKCFRQRFGKVPSDYKRSPESR